MARLGIGKSQPCPAGLRHDGIVACRVPDRPTNGEMFTAWVGQCLASALAPGDVGIVDNFGSQKGTPSRQVIRDAGAHLLFLPP
jgi:transposase